MPFDLDAAIAQAVETDRKSQEDKRRADAEAAQRAWQARKDALQSLLHKKIGDDLIAALGGSYIYDGRDAAYAFERGGRQLLKQSPTIGAVVAQSQDTGQWQNIGGRSELLLWLGSLTGATSGTQEGAVAARTESNAIMAVFAQAAARVLRQGFRWPKGSVLPLLHIWWEDCRSKQDGWATLTNDLAFRTYDGRAFVEFHETLLDGSVIPYVYAPRRCVYYLWDHKAVGELLNVSRATDLPHELLEPITLIVHGAVRHGQNIYRRAEGQAASQVIGVQPLKWIRDYLGVVGVESVISTTLDREEEHDGDA